ncbi:unnamed protein product [Polarella glacialis]|uniref:Uncharacterized protein n=1 Tax=Polarella glacialis TaxID=89957 RepID=A0A813M1E7_POLGL|nr:unnamed protein product [Polarella glacialis]
MAQTESSLRSTRPLALLLVMSTILVACCSANNAFALLAGQGGSSQARAFRPQAERLTQRRADALPEEQAQHADADASQPRQGLSAKGKRLAALGTAGALSYALLKGLKHAIIAAIAWYLVARRTGVPPPQSWPAFLTSYAAVYLASSPIQPVKWAAIAAITPAMDRFMTAVAGRTRMTKKQVAGLLLVAIGAGSAAIWALGVVCASALAGVPVW